MKKRFFLLLTLISLFLGVGKYIVNACTCLVFANNFCDNMSQLALIEQLNNTNNTIVVLGVKVDTVSYAMRFKIIDILHGEETEDTITVWGDTSKIHCVIDVREFDINDTLVLPLFRVTGNNFPKVTGDYVLSECVQYLPFKNDKVQGYIRDGYASMEYSTFKNVFYTCYLPVGVQELNEERGGFKVQLYPNPVQDVLHINLLNKAVETTPITYSLINTVGKVVFSTTTVATQQSINTSQLPAGVYFAVLETATQKITQKIIIQ